MRPAAVVATLLAFQACASAETLRIGGTGAAMELMRRLGEAFTASDPGTRVEIVSGLGSTGGIRALVGEALEIAVSARTLTTEEAGRGLRTIAAARTPFLFASSHPAPNGLRRSDVARMIGDLQARWDDGAPVRLVLRPRGETDNMSIAEYFPGAGTALEKARGRPEVPVAATDQDNATLAEQMPGSFVGITLTQLKLEQRNLRAVRIDGIEPSLENVRRGTYPFTKVLYLVVAASPGRSVERFLTFLRSPEAARVLEESYCLPVH